MVNGSRKDNLSAVLEIRKHEIISDLAEKLGGKDEGPDPHEILEAALAACTVITVQMYAQRKQWGLESTDVLVRIDSEGKEGNRITRDVKFVGDLTDDQRSRLLEIANKCPIHNFLTTKTEIETRLSL